MSHNQTIDSVVVTGAAGFIGYHVSLKLLDMGYEIYGFDSLNNYYDIKLKNDRLANLKKNKNFVFYHQDISDKHTIELLNEIQPKVIINLAAQAGVRHSLTNPDDYVKANIIGFLNILEYCKSAKSFSKLVYASTSSVYGGNTKMPFEEKDRVDQPLQFYAVTKRTNELMAEAYSKLYDIKSIGLRFFTVYGPWGRPDMALFKFTKNISDGKKIEVFNNGEHIRDFTFIDDIANGIILCSMKNSINKESRSEIYNIGGGNPIRLMDFIKEIEINLDKRAEIEFLPLQKGDVVKTKSDISKINSNYGYVPSVDYKDGVKLFIDWYKSYYQ